MATFENTLNFNKRQILRELKLYSLESILITCISEIKAKKFLANWVIYLIIKWKFIATDKSRDYRKGRTCDSKTLIRWCNLIWRSESNLDNLHHFLRNMFDTQLIWQKKYVLDVFFFPGFIAALDEEDPIRLAVLNHYNMPISELELLFPLLYFFPENHQLAIETARLVSPDFHRALLSTIEDLTTDWQEISGYSLAMDGDYEHAFSKYLADIDLHATTFEGTESPWIEQHPIIAFGTKRLFSLDNQLWQRRISTYFYEKFSEEIDNFSDLFGLSFENYCKKLASYNFLNGRIKTDLPQTSKNADFIMEDEKYFYIVEIKHKKYDSRIFSIADAKLLSCQLFNQVVKGYQQIKATAKNIDEHRIFKFKRKPLNKRRIGFVVTERSYRIGHGAHFTELAGQDFKIEDSHIHDNDIYFIGVQEFELLLLASRESGSSLGAVVESSFSERQHFIERRDLVQKFDLQSQTLAEMTKDKCMAEFERRLKP
ncbi:hypothetical protein [Diaphorobacter nitroreducens]